MATLRSLAEDASDASSSGSGSSGSRSRSSSGSSLGSRSSSGDTASSGAEEAEEVSAVARALVLARDPAAADAYERLAVECPLYRAKTISAAERDRRALCESSLTYGEILFEPFETALRKIKHLYGGLGRPGGTFVDVGSGSGKAVFAAALLHEWESLHGIEILEGLHAVSQEMLGKWYSPAFQGSLRAAGKGTHGEAPIDFVHADATRVDWSDADVLFMNSTCYDERLMLALASISERMREGAFCVTFTKRLPSGLWKVLEFETHKMSWGSATIYIHKKVSGPGPHQYVGVAPLAAAAGDFSAAGKLLASCGPGYTSDKIALDFSLQNRVAWDTNPPAGGGKEEAAGGGGGGGGGGSGSGSSAAAAETAAAPAAAASLAAGGGGGGGRA